MAPTSRSPTIRSIPSSTRTASIRPERTPNSARSSPAFAAYSPGARLMSAAARASRSRASASSVAKTSNPPISSAVTTARDTSSVPTSYRGVTVWFTGLPRSGKTTLSSRVTGKLRALGVDRLELLDGDAIRKTFSVGLGYSKADRDENVRRIAAHADDVTSSGAICIVAAISPYAAARAAARALIGDFVEVYCTAPVEICAARDTSGLYERAFAGEIDHFTGVSDPYEPPQHPELRLDTVSGDPEELSDAVIRHLVEHGYLELDLNAVA